MYRIFRFHNYFSITVDLQITFSDTINNIPDIKNKAENLLNKFKKCYDTNTLLVNIEKTQVIFL